MLIEQMQLELRCRGSSNDIKEEEKEEEEEEEEEDLVATTGGHPQTIAKTFARACVS